MAFVYGDSPRLYRGIANKGAVFYCP